MPALGTHVGYRIREIMDQLKARLDRYVATPPQHTYRTICLTFSGSPRFADVFPPKEWVSDIVSMWVPSFSFSIYTLTCLL